MRYQYIIRRDIHSIDTWEAEDVEVPSVEAVASSIGEVASVEAKVATTCSDKLNENGIETMERKSEMVTNVKEYDEVHIPIVRNWSLDLEAGANLSYD